MGGMWFHSLSPPPYQSSSFLNLIPCLPLLRLLLQVFLPTSSSSSSSSSSPSSFSFHLCQPHFSHFPSYKHSSKLPLPLPSLPPLLLLLHLLPRRDLHSVHTATSICGEKVAVPSRRPIGRMARSCFSSGVIGSTTPFRHRMRPPHPWPSPLAPILLSFCRLASLPIIPTTPAFLH